MVKLPLGVDIHNLIDDLRIFSWEAADILLNYSQILQELGDKTNILKNKNANFLDWVDKFYNPKVLEKNFRENKFIDKLLFKLMKRE